MKKRTTMDLGDNNLVVFAHPDDETIFFGGLIIAELGRHADLLCVTDGNWGGRGAQRRSQLKLACEQMGVREVDCLGYPDNPVLHLPVEDLGVRLRERVQERGYQAVVTHSPHGEYGNFNHMDISFAAHEYLSDLVPVYSYTDMLFPDFEVRMTREMYEKKVHIMTSVYFEEIKDNWRKLPMLPYEGYVRLDRAEARAIYRLCTDGVRPREDEVPRYRSVVRFLDQPWK